MATERDLDERPKLRQQVLMLWLENSALDSKVIGGALYDGTGRTHHKTGDSDGVPYHTGLDALLDGWRLIQVSQLIPDLVDVRGDTSFLKHECVFERLEPINA